MKYKTRFAPSPTGFLHVGGVRTALYGWLASRHNQGSFLLRIEDTDVNRETEGAVDAIMESMKWLGLKWDEGPYYQTKRFDRYNEVVEEMLQKGTAYKCFCSKERLDALKAEQELQKLTHKYDRKCLNIDGSKEEFANKPFVVRFKNKTGGIVGWDDSVRGRIEFQNDHFDDFIIRRSDNIPTYNFVVVVDDMDMDITHVFRAEEHINNTPKQINIFEALGVTVPVFGHVSPINGPDGKKLSKRHGAANVMQFREQGFLPQALANYLIRLGWGHKDQEIFSLEEAINLFEIEKVSKSPSCFDYSKLSWLNKLYLKTLAFADIKTELLWHLDKLNVSDINTDDLEKIALLFRDRCDTVKDLAEKCKIFSKSYNVEHQQLSTEDVARLKGILVALKTLDVWTEESIKTLLSQHINDNQLKIKELYLPIRQAVFGTSDTPTLESCLFLLGQDKVITRLEDRLL